MPETRTGPGSEPTKAPRRHRISRLAVHAASRSARIRKALLYRVRRRDDWHWFDHPEMQARIAEAEADLCEGRVTRLETREEIEAYLDSLA
jgi:hypothetical protein